MRRLLFVFAVTLCSLATATRADAATVTFDNRAGTAATVTNPGSDAFTEAGLYVEAFWRAGTTFTSGHFHLGTGSNGTLAEFQHWNGSNDLQGFLVKRVDGQAFSLNSLQYRVSDTTSILGYSSSDPKVLVSATFNPSGSVASQFTGFSVPVSGSLNTLSITGFDNVTQVFISSSASIQFDNIVIGDPVSGSAVPEPASMSLLALGAVGMGAYRLRLRRRTAAEGETVA